MRVPDTSSWCILIKILKFLFQILVQIFQISNLPESICGRFSLFFVGKIEPFFYFLRYLFFSEGMFFWGTCFPRFLSFSNFCSKRKWVSGWFEWSDRIRWRQRVERLFQTWKRRGWVLQIFRSVLNSSLNFMHFNPFLIPSSMNLTLKIWLMSYYWQFEIICMNILN